MATVDDTAYRYRTAAPEAIEALDGSFTTDTVFQVTVTEEGFALREIPVDPEGCHDSDQVAELGVLCRW